MQVSDPIESEDVVLAVAESELFSRRFALGLGTRIPDPLNERLRYDPQDEWSPDDRRAVADALRQMHPPLLESLLNLDVSWFDAMLDVTDLPDLRTVSTRELRELAPDRQLTTLVASLERGKDTPDAEFSGAYRKLKGDFRPSRWRGRPCLVAKEKAGPFTIIEGLTRLAVCLALSQMGRPTMNPIPVYLGITDRLGAWEFLADPPVQGPGSA